MRRGKQRTMLQGSRGALREPLDLETAVQTEEPAGLWVPPPKPRAMLAAQRWSRGGGGGGGGTSGASPVGGAPENLVTFCLRLRTMCCSVCGFPFK